MHTFTHSGLDFKLQGTGEHFQDQLLSEKKIVVIVDVLIRTTTFLFAQ